MARKATPTLPDITVVHEVVRLARTADSTNRRRPEEPGNMHRTPEQVPVEFGYMHGTPELVALREYLARQPEERMVEFLALYWLGNGASQTARSYPDRYSHATRNLAHGAHYLSAKPLARALPLGLRKLGLEDDRGLLHPQGGRCRGGCPSHPDPADRFPGPVNPGTTVREILPAETGIPQDAIPERPEISTSHSSLAMPAENAGGTRCNHHPSPDTPIGRERTEFGIAVRLRTDRVVKRVSRWPTDSSASPSRPKRPIGSPTPAVALSRG